MFSLDWPAQPNRGLLAAAGFLAVSCAGNPPSRIMPDLHAGKPVCLTMDWGRSTRPSFSGRAAPDTLLLLPERGSRPGVPASADSRGMVALSTSQQDRQGGGWTWWTKGDTLEIMAWNPTEQHLGIQAERADASGSATWAGGDSGPERGTVTLHPYKCTGLPAPTR